MLFRAIIVAALALAPLVGQQVSQPPSSATQIISLFGSGECSGYLKSDGTCDTPAAAGALSSAAVVGKGQLIQGSDGARAMEASILDGLPLMTKGVLSTAAYGNLVTLWASGKCSGYLKSDGTCDTGDGTGTDDQTAAEVAFTPAGNVAATNVQAAIAELDGDLGVANVGFSASVTVGTDTLTITPGSSRRGNTVTAFAGGTAVGPTGTGTVYVFIGTDGAVNIGSADWEAGVTDVGVLTTLVKFDSQDSIPANGIPVAECTVTASNWVSCTDTRRVLSDMPIVAGAAISVSVGAGATIRTLRGRHSSEATVVAIPATSSDHLITLNNANPVAVTIPGQGGGYGFDFLNLGVGAATISIENSTNFYPGATATIVLQQYEYVGVLDDGADSYHVTWYVDKAGTGLTKTCTGIACTWAVADSTYQPLDAALTALAAGSDFVDFAGPTTAAKTFTLPDADATLSYTVYSGTKALDTDEIASTACDTMTQAATGAAATDVISWTFNADVTAVTGYAPATAGGLSIFLWPTSGQINIKVCNPTAGAITPGAVSLNLRITR